MSSYQGKSTFQSQHARKFLKLKGTKPSPQNAQLLASTGVPSLDHVIGGGIPVGSVFLLEEDSYSKYSKLLLKYFLAEGIVCENDIFTASFDISPSQLIKELPGLVEGSPSFTPKSTSYNGPSEKMKIAWRYQSQDVVKTFKENSTFGHYYDLSRSLDQKLVDRVNITKFDGIADHKEDNPTNKSSILDTLYNNIENRISDGNFKVDSKNMSLNDEKTVLRIGINSLGTLLWHDTSTRELSHSIPLFLLQLKALMRASLSIAFVTVPTELLSGMESNGCLRRLESIADIVIRLESFIGSDKEKNRIFQDFHGLLHIRKLARINSLCCHIPSSFDLAFKLKKKSFVIETLHLPPDLSETVSRSQQNTVSSGLSCSSASKQGFDF